MKLAKTGPVEWKWFVYWSVCRLSNRDILIYILLWCSVDLISIPNRVDFAPVGVPWECFVSHATNKIDAPERSLTNL